MTVLAIIGWLAIVAGWLWVSAFWAFCAWDGLGRYNIGGVPNSGARKFRIVLGAVVLAEAWWFIASIAPFHFTVS